MVSDTFNKSKSIEKGVKQGEPLSEPAPSLSSNTEPLIHAALNDYSAAQDNEENVVVLKDQAKMSDIVDYSELLLQLEMMVGKDWLILGHFLSVKDHELDFIDLEYDDLKEKAHRMFSVWKNQQNSPTLDDLAKAIYKINRSDLIRVMEKFSIKSFERENLLKTSIEEKESTDAKVKNIIIEKVTDWKRFARLTNCSNNVNGIVEQIDHDVRGGDKSKVERFLTKLVELHPNDYITYIQKSLKAMGRNDLHQSIASIYAEQQMIGKPLIAQVELESDKTAVSLHIDLNLSQSAPSSSSNDGPSPRYAAIHDSAADDDEEKVNVLKDQIKMSDILDNRLLLLQLALMVGKDWQKLGRFLLVSDNELDLIDVDYNDLEEKARRMFCGWKNQQKSPTSDDLAKAIYQINRYKMNRLDLIRVMEKFLNKSFKRENPLKPSIEEKEKETSFRSLIREPPIYDAFISYSSKNREWVKDTLLCELDSRDIKCCIDFRDFIPGELIAKNISDGIRNSRKTIAVLSTDFLESEYCKGELQTALHARRAICISIDKCAIPYSLKKKVLKWKNNDKFWRNFVFAILS